MNPRARPSLLGAVLVAAGLLGVSPYAFAVGGGSVGSGARTGSSAAEEANDAAARDPDFKAGMDAAKAKDWPTVVERMRLYVVRDPKNADAWNELGHAYRQLGDMDNSFKHYAMALKIDPRHLNAREYLGEAYLMVGNLEGAELQLKALDRLCFYPCEQYKDLKEQIRRYRLEHPQAAKN